MPSGLVTMARVSPGMTSACGSLRANPQPPCKPYSLNLSGTGVYACMRHPVHASCEGIARRWCSLPECNLKVSEQPKQEISNPSEVHEWLGIVSHIGIEP